MIKEMDLNVKYFLIQFLENIKAVSTPIYEQVITKKVMWAFFFLLYSFPGSVSSLLPYSPLSLYLLPHCLLQERQVSHIS
jgi:hypothetical protein